VHVRTRFSLRSFPHEHPVGIAPGRKVPVSFPRNVEQATITTRAAQAALRALPRGRLRAHLLARVSRNGVRRFTALRTTLTERSHEAYQRIVRNRQLAEEIGALRSDARALEEMARTRLGVVGRDEVVLVFPEEDSTPR